MVPRQRRGSNESVPKTKLTSVHDPISTVRVEISAFQGEQRENVIK